jgi:RNA polymerase sigma-70 factor, ECF subfamily
VQQPTDTTDEHDIMRRMRDGDEAALQELCQRYRQRLWGYLWQQLDGDTGLAEEVLQDTLLAVWNGAARFRGDAPVAIWVFRIAHHTAATARRNRGRRVEGHLVPLSSAESDSTLEQRLALNSPEAEILERMAMRSAIEQLSPKHREVIDLVCYHGFAIDEVAHILDIPSGTVRSRLSYARQALARTLSMVTTGEASDHDQ